MAEELVYHYTSVESLYHIVKSRRFRLGSIFFMNDSMEVQWCFDLALTMMKERKEEFGVLIDLIQKRGFEHIFCGCFSALCDDLSQWRGYADDGRGVAIGVDISKVTDGNTSNVLHSLERVNVVYKEEEQKAEVNKLLTEHLGLAKTEVQHGEFIRQLGTYVKLSSLAVKCKTPAFAAEEETRLVLRPTIPMRDWRYDKKSVKTFPHGIEFLSRGGSLVPYADIDLPLEAIGSLHLGPKFGDEMAEVALQLFLSKEGVVEHVIEGMVRSEASYR